MSKLSKKIKEIRLENGMSQDQMAKALGYANRSAINKIESGQRGVSYDKLLILIRDFMLDMKDVSEEEIRNIDKLIEEQGKPSPDTIYPISNYKYEINVKPTIRNKNIIVGDFTYIADKEFESHVTHLYEWNNDKLIIGKFCQIAKGVEFIMNGANHQMNAVTTFPFFSLDKWDAKTPNKKDMPLKGDTVIGNDVWIGQNAVILPGVHIGDGAIIGCNSIVSKDVEPYTIVAGNPIRVIRKRFDDELIKLLEEFKWWNKSVDKIIKIIPILTSSNLIDVKKYIKQEMKKQSGHFKTREVAEKFALTEFEKFRIIQEKKLVSDYDLFIENAQIEEIPKIIDECKNKKNLKV